MLHQIQMDTHNICLYKEAVKKYTGCKSEDYGIAWLWAYRGAYRGMCSN